jgi:hypothetical protein
LFGQEHVERYSETDGEEGHPWQGTAMLLLVTIGATQVPSGPRR